MIAKFLKPRRSMRFARSDILMTVGNSRIGQRLNLWDRAWFDRMM